MMKTMLMMMMMMMMMMIMMLNTKLQTVNLKRKRR